MWNSLKQYTKDSKWEKSANAAADQERNYWLVKKAMIGWINQTEILSNKHNLYKLLHTHYEIGLKRRVFKLFSSVVKYQQEQRYNDLLIVHEVVKIRQRNILKKWHNLKQKLTATKMLTILSERAIKGVVLRGMYKRYQYQSCVVSYMEQRRPHYQMLTAFNRFSQVISKKHNIEYALTSIDSRRDFWSLRKSFTEWSKLSNSIQHLKKLKLANTFARFKKYAQIQKYKRLAVSHYEHRLKQKLLNTIYNQTKISDRDYEVSHLIRTKQIYKLKSSVMLEWYALYLKVSTDRLKLENFIKKQHNLTLLNIVSEWRDYTAEKVRVKTIENQLRLKVDGARVKRGFDSFMNGVNRTRQIKINNAKADKFCHTL